MHLGLHLQGRDVSSILVKLYGIDMMSDTDIRPNLPKRCKICNLGLVNSMEQLVECCPFCFRTNYCE